MELYAVLIIILIAIGVTSQYVRSSESRQSGRRKLAVEYRLAHPEAIGLISYAAENIDGSQWQFYGDVAGVAVRPGMELTLPDMRKVVVSEVYADEKTPDQPSPQAPVGAEFIAVVVEVQGTSDYKYFEQFYAQNPVILLAAKDFGDTSAASSPPVDAQNMPAQPQIIEGSSKNTASLVLFALGFIVVAAMIGNMIYQRAPEDRAGKPSGSSVAASTETKQVKATLSGTNIHMSLPAKMEMVEQQDTVALFGALANGSTDTYTGEVIVRVYPLEDSGFAAIKAAMQNSTHGELLGKELQRFCANPNVSTEARVGEMGGAQASYVTAFKCPELSDASDKKGFVAVAVTEKAGFIILISAQRAVWEAGGGAWAGIGPSLKLESLAAITE